MYNCKIACKKLNFSLIVKTIEDGYGFLPIKGIIKIEVFDTV